MTSRRTIVSGDISLTVFTQGDPANPAVLLVHGYPDTHSVWDEVCDALAEDHFVVRYDVRGSGESGRPQAKQGYRLDLLADDLFAVADAVSPDRPIHLVGHDWGSIQAWHAVTDDRAVGRIASYTTMSGPCLDHAGHWIRHRMTHPTPHNLRQLLNQELRSWYIAVFHVPLLAPAVWRLGLAAQWGRILHRAEGVEPRPGHPQATLRGDAVRGISLYRANMGPRVMRRRRRDTQIPVQLIILIKDRFVTPALVGEDLDQWVPRLWRRSIQAGHWSALSRKAATVARMISEFAAYTDGTGDAETSAALDHARSRPTAHRGSTPSRD